MRMITIRKEATDKPSLVNSENDGLSELEAF